MWRVRANANKPQLIPVRIENAKGALIAPIRPQIDLNEICSTVEIDPEKPRLLIPSLWDSLVGRIGAKDMSAR